MDPRRKTDTRQDRDDLRDEGPSLEEQDWEAVESGAIRPASIPENGDLRYDVERSGEATDDDDNPYQNSDEALPEDEGEAALRRNPGKEGGRFDEV